LLIPVDAINYLAKGINVVTTSVTITAVLVGMLNAMIKDVKKSTFDIATKEKIVYLIIEGLVLSNIALIPLKFSMSVESATDAVVKQAGEREEALKRLASNALVCLPALCLRLLSAGSMVGAGYLLTKGLPKFIEAYRLSRTLSN
jgi:hypothetical protein